MNAFHFINFDGASLAAPPVTALTVAMPSIAAPSVEAPIVAVESTEAVGDTLHFWPEVVDTVNVAESPIQDLERMRARIGSNTYIPLGVKVAGDQSVADLLDQTVGVHVQRFGGLGSHTLASVRGSTPGQVQVYLDDVPIGGGAGASVNLSLLPLAELDHAEVYRGAQTLTLGGPPAAGVVRLVSPDKLDMPLQLALGSGSFGTRSVRGQWGREAAAFGLYVGGQWRSSDGDYPYLNRNGTRHNESDDRTVDRRNNSFEDASGMLRLRWRSSRRSRMTYSLQALDRDSGIPGPEAVPTSRTRFSVEQRRHRLAFTQQVDPSLWSRDAGLIRWRVALFHDSNEDRFEDPLGEVGLGEADVSQESVKKGAHLHATLPWLTAGQMLEVQGFLDREVWTPEDRRSDARLDGAKRDQRSASASHLSKWKSLSVTLSRTANWVSDERSSPDSDSSVDRQFSQSSVGTRWQIHDRLSLQGSRGRFFRVPTFPELFGQNGLQDGNDVLRPERGLQWDLGVLLQGSPRRRPTLTKPWLTRLFEQSTWTMRATYFENLTRDKIVLLQNSQRTVKAHNLDRAWTRGIEWTGTLRGEAHADLRWRSQLDWTWQQARDVGPSPTYRGNAIPSLPEHERHWSTRLQWKTWSLEHGWTARSEAFRDRYNSVDQKAPGYSLHDLTLALDGVVRDTTLRFILRNMGDKRVQDIDAYPLPGRSFFVEIIARIGS